MLRISFAISLLLTVQLTYAQVCGTPQQPLLERVEENKKSVLIHQRGAVKYIPITFHLVANTAGSGRIHESAVLEQLCNLNEQYADQDVIFFIDSLSYFDNDATYETPSSVAATIQMRVREDNNSLNVYITNKADSGNEGPGTTLAYYDPPEDWIVSRKDQIGPSTKTLAHEIGHFFGLPHTFSGWECFPYTIADYGNPVNRDFTIPCSGGGGSVLIELANGTNCNSAGDKICDTPADYNLSIVFDPGCDANTVVKDKNGELISPIVENYMSYYSGCASNSFTQTQKNLMNTDYFKLNRNYIRTNPKIPSNTDSVEAPVTYITPINGELTPGITNILLDWQDTPGATDYLVMVARNSSFSLNVQTFLTTQSQVIIDELPVQTYYWKVFPFNESRTCAGFSPTQSFKVSGGTGINEIGDINEYMLFPNPSRDQAPVVLALTSQKNFEATLTLTDASGRRLSHRSLVVPSGISEHMIETDQLPAGLYFITLNSTNGKLVEKLLVF